MEDKLKALLGIIGQGKDWLDEKNQQADQMGQDIDKQILGNLYGKVNVSPSNIASQQGNSIGAINNVGSKISLAERALNNPHNADYLSTLKAMSNDPNESKFITGLWEKARAKDNLMRGQQQMNDLAIKRNTDKYLQNLEDSLHPVQQGVDLPANPRDLDVLGNDKTVNLLTKAKK